VVVLPHVDDAVRGVPADGGGRNAQGLFDALEHLAIVLHYGHEDVSSSIHEQGYIAPVAQTLVELDGATEALDEERGGGGHLVWTTGGGDEREAADSKSACLNSWHYSNVACRLQHEECEQKHHKLTPEEGRGQAEGGWRVSKGEGVDLKK